MNVLLNFVIIETRFWTLSWEGNSSCN